MSPEPRQAAGAVIVGDKPRGCGFVVAPLIAVTANHLVRGPDDLPFAPHLVRLEVDGRQLAVTRIDPDLELDVAVLHLAETSPSWLPWRAPREGERWRVTTRPSPNDPMLEGRITAVRRPYRNAKGRETVGLQLLADTPADEYEGYSGSPVESPAGVVTGVLVEQIRSRLRAPPGEVKPATRMLYATAIEDVADRFDLHAELTPVQEAGVIDTALTATRLEQAFVAHMADGTGSAETAERHYIDLLLR